MLPSDRETYALMAVLVLGRLKFYWSAFYVWLKIPLREMHASSL
jgi:hypothetical protein